MKGIGSIHIITLGIIFLVVWVCSKPSPVNDPDYVDSHQAYGVPNRNPNRKVLEFDYENNKWVYEDEKEKLRPGGNEFSKKFEREMQSKGKRSTLSDRIDREVEERIYHDADYYMDINDR